MSESIKVDSNLAEQSDNGNSSDSSNSVLAPVLAQLTRLETAMTQLVSALTVQAVQAVQAVQTVQTVQAPTATSRKRKPGNTTRSENTNALILSLVPEVDFRPSDVLFPQAQEAGLDESITTIEGFTDILRRRLKKYVEEARYGRKSAWRKIPATPATPVA